MMSIALRRSYSVAPRQTLAAIDTLLRHNQYSCPTTSSTNLEVPGNGCSGCEIRSFSTFRASKPDMPFGFQAMGFHAKPSPLNYQASVVLQAEFAVDEYSSYGDSSKGSADDEGLEIAKLGISQEIVSSLSKKGITKLFPIQKAVLDPAMKGRDMIGRARTGTGKTLAFGIPILDKIIRFNAKHGRGRNPMALVLAPTRELAKQVEKEFCDSAPSLDTICCYGGTPISNQMRQLNYGVDITVGTPGRIIDLLNRGALNLSEVQFLVLDEADQMLQVGFQENVETILENLPQRRQTLMFSATMPSWIRKITESYLKNPLMIDLVGDSDQKLADGISLYSIASETYGKASILGPLITEHAKGGKCIVFTQTKRDADRLAYAMAKSYKCEALHGDISQDQRERTLAGFRSGHFNILVATDVASRGLDIPNVDLVIHYELPNNSEIFVHRSGRTGRAGKKGNCILMYTEDQNHFVRGIERDVGCKFTELPRIAGEGGDSGILGLMSGGRFGSSNRYGSQGGGGFGRSSGYGYSGQMGRSGGPSTNRSGPGRSSGFGDFGSSRSSGFGDFGSSRSSGFGSNDGDAGQSSGFGDFGSSRSSKFGNFGSSRSSGFGSNDGDAGQSSGFGDFGSSRSSKFGNFGSSRSSGFGSNDGDAGSSGRFGSFGDFGSSRPSGLGGSSSGRSSGGFGDFRSKIGEVLARDLNGK